MHISCSCSFSNAIAVRLSLRPWAPPITMPSLVDYHHYHWGPPEQELLGLQIMSHWHRMHYLNSTAMVHNLIVLVTVAAVVSRHKNVSTAMVVHQVATKAQGGSPASTAITSSQSIKTLPGRDTAHR